MRLKNFQKHIFNLKFEIIKIIHIQNKFKMKKVSLFVCRTFKCSMKLQFVAFFVIAQMKLKISSDQEMQHRKY